MKNKNICIIGSGSWGCALAIHLAKMGHKIKMWSFSQQEAQMINEEKINELIKTVDEKINIARDNILNGLFDINPKRLNGENVSCLYCPFIDICYHQAKDIVDIGGDDDASVD